MRSSRASRRAAWPLLVALALGAGSVASAHRRDEYLQAARLGIDPGRVLLELDLTPGVAVADAILADLDRNRDGSLSAEEQRAYAGAVVSALELEADGARLPVQLEASSFPDADAIRRGDGTIHIRSSAALPRLPAGFHQLTFRNRHHPDRSVYLANALTPQTDRVEVTAQRRHADQRELTIDYVLRAVPAPPAGWLPLLGGIAAAAALSALLLRQGVRRVRS